GDALASVGQLREGWRDALSRRVCRDGRACPDRLGDDPALLNRNARRRGGVEGRIEADKPPAMQLALPDEQHADASDLTTGAADERVEDLGERRRAIEGTDRLDESSAGHEGVGLCAAHGFGYRGKRLGVRVLFR